MTRKKSEKKFIDLQLAEAQQENQNLRQQLAAMQQQITTQRQEYERKMGAALETSRKLVQALKEQHKANEHQWEGLKNDLRFELETASNQKNEAFEENDYWKGVVAQLKAELEIQRVAVAAAEGYEVIDRRDLVGSEEPPAVSGVAALVAQYRREALKVSRQKDDAQSAVRDEAAAATAAAITPSFNS